LSKADINKFEISITFWVFYTHTEFGVLLALFENLKCKFAKNRTTFLNILLKLFKVAKYIWGGRSKSQAVGFWLFNFDFEFLKVIQNWQNLSNYTNGLGGWNGEH
jgi:hypothetical protein